MHTKQTNSQKENVNDKKNKQKKRRRNIRKKEAEYGTEEETNDENRIHDSKHNRGCSVLSNRRWCSQAQPIKDTLKEARQRQQERRAPIERGWTMTRKPGEKHEKEKQE